MIYAREFRPEDLKDIQPVESGLRSQYNPDLQQYNTAVTGIKDGRVIGCGGVYNIGNGIGETWLVLDVEAEKCPIAVGMWLKEGMKIISSNFRRLQCVVRADLTPAIKTVEFVGFDLEGKMKSYFEDTDGLMYGKLICQH